MVGLTDGKSKVAVDSADAKGPCGMVGHHPPSRKANALNRLPAALEEPEGSLLAAEERRFTSAHQVSSFHV